MVLPSGVVMVTMATGDGSSVLLPSNGTDGTTPVQYTGEGISDNTARSMQLALVDSITSVDEFVSDSSYAHNNSLNLSLIHI